MKKTKDLSQLAVDAVLCINLKDRNDKRTAMLKEFSKSGIAIDFFEAHKDVGNPERGCYNSHRDCAKLALERGYKRVLILEDDVIIDPFSVDTIHRVNRFMDEKNPEIFYLGILLGKIWLTWRRNIARVRGQGAHAYILSAAGCKKITEWEDYAGKGIDSIFSKRFKGYCVFPMVCYQNNSYTSDIQAYRNVIDGTKPSCIAVYDNMRTARKKQYTKALKNIAKTLLLKH